MNGVPAHLAGLFQSHEMPYYISRDIVTERAYILYTTVYNTTVYNIYYRSYPLPPSYVCVPIQATKHAKEKPRSEV